MLIAIYPCTCGNATCTRDEICDSSASFCRAPCRVADDSGPSALYPCICGNATCIGDEICDSSARFCRAPCAMADDSGISALYPISPKSKGLSGFRPSREISQDLILGNPAARATSWEIS